jgi:hypothetical protein
MVEEDLYNRNYNVRHHTDDSDVVAVVVHV